MAVAIDFDADFDAQIAQARAQRVVLPKEFYRLPPEKRAQAFTVSGLARLDQVQAVADALAKLQAEGGTFEDFRKWALQQDWSLPRHRLETIYRNAVQTAYMAGHWRRFEETKDDLPYLMYDAINDSRTRPSHLAMDGVIRPVGDPIWKKWSPPCGFRCRCSLRSVSAREAQRRGGVTQSIPAEAAPDEGWGGDPRQWGQTLRAVADRKTAAAAPAIGNAGAKALDRPESVEDYIRAGRAVTETLPDGWREPIACHAALMDLLKAEVGIGVACKTSSSGSGAKLVRQASARFPSSWVAEADRLGELRIHASRNTRGYSYTEKMERDQLGLLLTLPGFGRMHDVKKGTGFIQVRSGDIGNAVHEYAHRLQAALPELDRMFQLLHRQRVLGQPIRRLRDLMPESGYGRDELTREDRYTDPYQGKEYVSGVPVGSEHVPPGAALEVMTMGFETVLGLAAEGPRMAQSVSRFRKMYLEDREMFDFIVGLLRHWKP